MSVTKKIRRKDKNHTLCRLEDRLSMLESSVFVVELGVLDGNSQNVAGG